MAEATMKQRIAAIEFDLAQVQMNLNALILHANENGEMTEMLKRDVEERQLALNMTRRKVEHLKASLPSS